MRELWLGELVSEGDYNQCRGRYRQVPTSCGPELDPLLSFMTNKPAKSQFGTHFVTKFLFKAFL